MKLVLLRHGESVWNLENRFTGWTDVGLSLKGKVEAKDAGKVLKEKGFNFDIAYTSVLKRAIDTLKLVEEEMNTEISTIYNWKLNERHYGALQGLNKEETSLKYGKKQVHLWRRSYDVKPPLLDINDERYPGNDIKYKNLSSSELPIGECLKDTYMRAIPYYNEVIKKSLKEGKDVLIVAHGNSLRSIVKYLENISDEDIMEVEIPTGKPYVYEMNNNLNIIKKYYL